MEYCCARAEMQYRLENASSVKAASLATGTLFITTWNSPFFAEI
jgi:hypothetical protein